MKNAINFPRDVILKFYINIRRWSSTIQLYTIYAVVTLERTFAQSCVLYWLFGEGSKVCWKKRRQSKLLI